MSAVAVAPTAASPSPAGTRRPGREAAKGAGSVVRMLTTYSRRVSFARIVDLKPNGDIPGAWLAKVACPSCGAEHTHGISAASVRRLTVPEWRDVLRATPHERVEPDSRPWVAGDRSAHCTAGSRRGYELVLSASDARRIRKGADS